ncbi:WD40 repeat domain-containing protein [Streptomyces sp. NPDC004609]|uniref:WD40 repeat domain-containing protein n=1 Tax=Streptomyces sp. NPDC004609 TaxID=3364704 RepID=UPI003674660B
MRRKDAVERLKALGAKIGTRVTERTDLIVLAYGERGPVPRTDTMLRTPYLDEDALAGMLERAEGVPGETGKDPDPPFPSAGDIASAKDAEDLRALLEGADWSAFVPARDVVPLRERLAGLETEAGVTDVHRTATRLLLERVDDEQSPIQLLHGESHDVEIAGHAMSPDGRWLVTGSWVGDDWDEGGVFQVWEVATGRCVGAIPKVLGGVGWPDYRRTIQWSADSTRFAAAYCTNQIGVWDPWRSAATPLASISVSDGNSRPSPFALSPDGHRVYTHCGTNGDGGLQGCLVPVLRGGLDWLPNHVDADHPYLMARELSDEVSEKFGQDRDADPDDHQVGEWIEDPRWSADGTRLFGSNGLCVDAATREVVWYEPARFSRPSPDGSLVAAVTDEGMVVRDATDGSVLHGPYDLGGGEPWALRWALGPRRLAVLTGLTDGTAHAVHVLDDGRLVGSVAVPHSARQDDDKWAGDVEAWAWSPDGERAACLTDDNTLEVWSLADPARPERLTAVPSEGADAVHWGVDDTLVLVSGTRVRFVPAGGGAALGDVTLLRTPSGPRPVPDEELSLFGRQIFVLDADTWAMTVDTETVVAPPGREEDLDAALAWSVGRRHSWPLRWGDVEVVPNALAAAEDSPHGSVGRFMLELSREALEEHLRQAAAEESAEWPPPSTAPVEELFEVARDAVRGLDAERWGFAVGPRLREAARLRAGLAGGASAALELAEEAPSFLHRMAAHADVAVVLARTGDQDAARTAFARAEELLPEVESRSGDWQEALNPDVMAAFAAACDAMGDRTRADAWFLRAREAINAEHNPWLDHAEILRAVVACGREDVARDILADTGRHPSHGSEREEVLVGFVRRGWIDLARDYQALPGWKVPYEVLEALADAGRPDLLKGWGDHNWSIEEEVHERARRIAAEGLPVRPPTPTDADVAGLAEAYAEIQKTAFSRRRRPTELLAVRAAACGHLSAAVDLLRRIPKTDDFNDRPSAAFQALRLALTGSRVEGVG